MTRFGVIWQVCVCMCVYVCVCGEREWASAKPSSLPECRCKGPGWQRGLRVSSPGLSIMRKIDRQDNIVHLHRQIHTYTLNIRTQMYTGNYREVYQSAGISPCLNACEQAIPSLPARLYREGTGITPPYFHCIFSFFLWCLFPHSQSPLSSLFPVSHFRCLCVRARIALSGVRLFRLAGHS